jgi:hypothetical protein
MWNSGLRPSRSRRAPTEPERPCVPESRTAEEPVPTRFRGAIFDVDGVLVDSPHQKAWRESLHELMDGEWSDIRSQTTWSPEAFTTQVYQTGISGKSRMDGARAALQYFQVPDVAVRAGQYAAPKQAMVVRLIEAGDCTATIARGLAAGYLVVRRLARTWPVAR